MAPKIWDYDDACSEEGFGWPAEIASLNDVRQSQDNEHDPKDEEEEQQHRQSDCE
jgi:hypothetical protein